MKIFRSFAAILIAAVVVTLAPAQQSEDIAVLRAKAEKGNGLAQYNLGLAYAEGRGIAVDRIEAYVWLSLARENGTRGRTLDNLTASLDKDSLAAAQQRLADLKAMIAGKIPVVTTTKSEPEVATTIKTTGAAYLTPDTVAVSANPPAVSAQIATLTADKKQLSEELAKAWKEIDGLNTALKKARIEAKTAKNSNAALADQENAAKFSRELEATVNHLNDQKAQLEKSLAATQTELASTKAELSNQSQRNEKLSAAEAARLTPSAEMAALGTKLADAQSQVATLTTDLATVRASETNLHDTIAQLEQEKAQLAAKPSFPDLSGKVAELETQLAQANRTAESASEAADTASKKSASDLSASTAEIQRLQSALAAKPDAPSYPDLSSKVTELENQLAEATRATKSASEAAEMAGKKNAAELSASTAEIQRLQSALAAKPDAPSYPDLSGKVRELEGVVADSKQQLAAATAAQSELQHKLADSGDVAQNSTKLVAEIAQLQHERDELTSRSAGLTDENARLRAEGERLQKLATDSGKQLQDATATAGRVKELETQTTDLKASLESATARIASLQQSLAAKSAAPAYPDLSGKVRELETRLTAVNQQADAAVQTAVNASKQNVADLNNAAARISQLEAQLPAKPAAPAAPDLSGRVNELEKQLADSSAQTERAKQEAAAMTRARDEALKNRGPAYPNLAGRVVELQTALADTKRDLADAQTALRTAQQAQETAAATTIGAPVAAIAMPAVAPIAIDSSDLQKQLAETENKLTTALRGYALLQNERDTQLETAAKSAETITNERNALSAQVATLTDQVEKLKTQGSADTAAAQAEASRANESLAALQRSTGQNANELAAARALIQQLQGSNTVLANENYLLKTKLSPGPVPVPATASVGPVPGAATAPRVHTVASGDTLFRISQRYYGTTNRWQEIYKANAAKLGSKGVLKIGMELTIP